MKPLVIAMGDPAGIGPEIVGKAWAARRAAGSPVFVAVGDPAVFDVPIKVIASIERAAEIFDRALPVLAVGDAGAVRPGSPDARGARAAWDALEAATALIRDGAAGGLVTGPVGKAQLYDIGFDWPGQTEFVAARCGIAATDAVMMLAAPSLRVVPLTTHVPLAEVSRLLTTELIVRKARVVAADLIRWFGIAAPRLAVAGLNPHAGEGGAIGREEIDAMQPACAALRAEGIDIGDPLAADTLFHPRARERYDVVLCPYHDQALIPLKTIHFDDGVNVTLGLPVVRTSPDHGTAFGIAGQGVAEPGAMIAAIRLAHEMAARLRA